jgi:ABC-type sugar transport system ATPase subunit
MAAANTVAIALDRVKKSFPGVRALQDVSFDVRHGEIHALVGENGAGKSTLVKLLAGLHHPDAGQISIDGRQVSLNGPRAARAHGVSVIPQEVDAVPELSAARNILLGMEGALSGRGRVSSSERERVREAVARAGGTFDVSRRAGDLSAPELRLCQIARTLLNPGEVIVLDEPTAVLSESDADHLLERLLAFREEGKAIVYVSHRLGEVLRIADRVTVLRDGLSRGTFDRAQVDRERIITLMAKADAAVAVSNRAAPTPPQRPEVAAGHALLETDSLSAGRAVIDVNLRVLPGQITGVAGVQGSGHGALLSVLAGRTDHDGGVVRVAGKPVAGGSVRAARKAGLLLVPADRRRAGIVPSLSLRDNLVLSPKSEYQVLGFRRRRLEAKLSQQYVNSFSIRTAGIGALSGQLSGGNQQKLALARAIESNPSVLLLEEPTQGIDIHSKSEVRALIKTFLREHPEKAVVVATSEFEELLDFADRVHVMRLGRLVASLSAAELTYTKILHHALP